MTRCLPLAAAALSLLAGSAFAQTTISHDKALAGSVSPGDAAGYPITLSQPGSYKLTSNLLVPAGKNGIEIAASEVTLDLNGFAIIGAGSCTVDAGYVVSNCTGTGSGITQTQASSLSTLMIRNGTVTGFATGVSAYGGMVENLIAKQNFAGFVLSGANGRDLMATGNQYGFQLGAATVSNATARGNSYGFYSASFPLNSAVRQGMAMFNAVGAANVRVSGIVHYDNKTNESGTQSF